MTRLLNSSLLLAAAALCAASSSAFASDVSDVAREAKLPVSVAENVFANVDAYVASPDAPGNRLMTGVLKDLALKAVKNRLSNLDDAGPGKISETTSEERNAVYKVAVRTTRRDSGETSECIDNNATITSSEALPVIKDGQFTFDVAHPRVSTYSWPLTFCRTLSGSEFSEWKLK